MYDELIHYAEAACNLYVPINTSNSSSKKPYLNKELISLIREKQNLRYRNCSSKWKNSNLCNQYKQLSKRVSFEISIARRKYESMIVEKAKKNPKVLYKYMNSQQYVRDYIKVLRQPNENKECTPLFKTRINDTTFNLTPEDIQYEDVLERLNNLDQNKTYGVDKLHPSILKNCATAFALPLTLIFMESVEKSQLPNQFNSANITALYKKGDKTDSESYRPISLPYYIRRNVDQGIPVNVVLLDLKKAFDIVPHHILKLEAYGVSGLALHWFQAFLSNRR
ncbi:uncharacterized protein LOC136095130 [Hydra vulgaris]|uniref:uncharacterized protein LOC136095130 n=1 Tax=Hydra vulgaris TaxID=6087 RepID=UPI0032EA2E47